MPLLALFALSSLQLDNLLNFLFSLQCTAPAFDYPFTGCDPFLRIFTANNRYYGLEIYDQRKHERKIPHFTTEEGVRTIDLRKHGILLHGTMRLELWDQDVGEDERMASLWFHTAFIQRNYLSFSKWACDHAVKDRQHKAFDEHFRLELFVHRVDGGATATAAKGPSLLGEDSAFTSKDSSATDNKSDGGEEGVGARPSEASAPETTDGDERYLLSLGSGEGHITEEDYVEWAVETAKAQGVSLSAHGEEAAGGEEDDGRAVGKQPAKETARREFLEVYRRAMDKGSGDVVASMRSIVERVRQRAAAAARLRNAIAEAGAAGVDGLPTAARVGASTGGGGLGDAHIGSYAAALAESPGGYAGDRRGWHGSGADAGTAGPATGGAAAPKTGPRSRGRVDKDGH